MITTTYIILRSTKSIQFANITAKTWIFTNNLNYSTVY